MFTMEDLKILMYIVVYVGISAIVVWNRIGVTK